MRRRHATILALMLAGGAATGLVAVTKTTGLGANAAAVSDAEIARRNAELDRIQKRLEKKLKQRPPALPARANERQRSALGGGSAKVAYVTYESSPATASGQPSAKKQTKRANGQTATAAGGTTSATETADAPVETATETGSSPAESSGGGTETGSSPVAGDSGGATSTGSSPPAGESGGGDDDGEEHGDEHEEEGDDD